MNSAIRETQLELLKELTHLGHCRQETIEKLKDLLAAPAAQAVDEDSERAKFEAWYAKEFAKTRGYEPTAEQMESMREGGHYGIERAYLNGCWNGWKASCTAPVQHSGCAKCGASTVNTCTGNGAPVQEPIGYIHKDDLARLLDDITWDGTHLYIGIDHRAQWREDTPYDHLVPIYARG